MIAFVPQGIQLRVAMYAGGRPDRSVRPRGAAYGETSSPGVAAPVRPR